MIVELTGYEPWANGRGVTRTRHGVDLSKAYHISRDSRGGAAVTRIQFGYGFFLIVEEQYTEVLRLFKQANP